MPSLQKRAPVTYWAAPPVWKGETVFVIGGGPSLRNFDIERLKPYNCIVINNAHLIAPWARFLVYHDNRWISWHLSTVKAFTGTVVTTNSKEPPVYSKRMQKNRKRAIDCTDPTCLAGIDSGTMGLNLAFHLGAKTIALAGFDMGFQAVALKDREKPEIKRLQEPLKVPRVSIPKKLAVDPTVLKHWHQEHPIPPKQKNYDRFLAQYPNIIKTLNSHSVRLVTLTRSRIDIPRVQLSAII